MRILPAILFTCLITNAFGNKISDGYKALAIYDYFKAKQLFYKSYSKYTCEASYGLAIIYHRNDNPFSNTDSAAKYIALSRYHFKDTITYSGFRIDSATLKALSNKISLLGFQRYCLTHSVSEMNHFLKHYHFSSDSLLQKCYYYRDEILLATASSWQSSDSLRAFMLNHPESYMYQKAQGMFYDFEFAENTKHKTRAQLEYFLIHFPKNPHVPEAEEALYQLVQQLHSPDSLYHFIKNFSGTASREKAWKLLYSVSVKKYSKEELAGFLKKYPDYPYAESLVKEISLTENILIPLLKKNKFGYIDTLANWVIPPQFDDALPFQEGFASVCKGDSCFYINKEGNKTSPYYFEETENYKDGIAVVKKADYYYLINRSGQFISKGYQDISPSSDKLFVCKEKNLYGAINAKGETIIPFTYTKLGNFKNDFAYYLSGLYGLVDINNHFLPAHWDWVSDVDTNLIAIVKKQNFFGLMQTNGQLVLPVQYDYITFCENTIYLVVKNNLYGFYNPIEKCFITAVDYDYNPSMKPDYYTNGTHFKLLKNGDVSMVDANGRVMINAGTFSDFFFAKNGITRIQRNNKFGYVDRKLKPVTPIEFEKASDFNANIAIVFKNGTASLIDLSGKIIFSQKNAELLPRSDGLFILEQNDLSGLINRTGKLLLPPEYESIEFIHPSLYLCTKNEELFIYNLHSQLLKKL
jgi:hypothetical protein